MKVKDLVLVNTRIIVEELRNDNFDIIVKSLPNGYKILEKKYVEFDYVPVKQKKYFIPGSDVAIDKYWGQKKGEVYKKGLALPLKFFTKETELDEEEIKVLEKKINEKSKKYGN